MSDTGKTEAQLVEELEKLRVRVAELEQAEAGRSQAKEELKTSDLRFRSLIEQTTDAVYCYEFDAAIPTDLPAEEQVKLMCDCTLVECNDVCAKSYGNDRAEDVVGRKPCELFGTTPGSLDTLFAAYVQGGYRIVDRESVENLEDGTERHYLYNGHGVVEDGRLLRVWGSFRDITGRKRAEEALALLDQARAALARELDLSKTIRTIVEAIATTFGYSLVALYLVEGDELVLQHQVGYAQSIARIPITRGIMGRVVRTGKPVLLEDASADPEFLAAIEGIVSEVSIPLFDEGKVAGVLNVESTQQRRLTETDLHLMTALSEHVSIAIERARLYTEVRDRAARLELITQIAQRTTAILPLDDLLQEAVNLIRDAFGYYNTALYLVEDDEIVLRAATGEAALPMIGHFTLPIGSSSITGWVAESGEPLLVPDVSKEPRFCYVEAAKDTMSEMTVPIKLKDIVIGVLNVEEDRLNAFSRADLRTMQTIAGQLAVVVENAGLYGGIRQRAHQLEALRRVTLDISAQLDLNSLLNALLENALKLLGAKTGGIYLYCPERDVLERTVSIGEGLPPLGTERRRGEGLTGKVWQSSKPIIVDDYREWKGRSRTHTGYAWTSSLGVPIKWGEELVGVINAGAASACAFSKDDARLLSQFADQAAVAIQNARLYEELEARGEFLEQEVEKRTAELRAANEHLRALGRLKDEFVSNVSHELRTPISNLNLHHGLLRSNPGKSEAYLATLERETKRLERIIEDLLQLSRMDQGYAAISLSPVDLNTLAERYVDDRPLLAESRGLRLTLDQQPDLPLVQADEGLLGQALSILLTNALNYTPSGGQVVVSTHLREMEGKLWVGLSVSDTGPGIPPAEQARLFERFFRGEAGRESGTPGTGLGLAIVKEIVDRHKGQTEIVSEGVPGKGATFSIWTPAEE